MLEMIALYQGDIILIEYHHTLMFRNVLGHLGDMGLEDVVPVHI